MKINVDHDKNVSSINNLLSQTKDSKLSLSFLFEFKAPKRKSLMKSAKKLSFTSQCLLRA